jgi:hypothetical protein
VEINVGEKDILNHPTLVTSLNTVKELEDNNATSHGSYKIEDRPTNLVELRGEPRCRTNRFRINHAFDRSNFSEFYGTGVQYIDNGSQAGSKALADRPAPQELSGNFFLAYVHFNFIGQDLFIRQFIYTILSRNILIHNIWYNTFERDWYATGKALGTVKLPSNSRVLLKGRRVFHEEWYTFNPGPNCGDDPRGTLSHVRDLKLLEDRMHTTGELFHTFDDNRGDMLFFKN